ncbi:unnamed protein product, partial [Linum tenue]
GEDPREREREKAKKSPGKFSPLQLCHISTGRRFISRSIFPLPVSSSPALCHRLASMASCSRLEVKIVFSLSRSAFQSSMLQALIATKESRRLYCWGLIAVSIQLLEYPRPLLGINPKRTLPNP